jgi:hypothetical protein
MNNQWPVLRIQTIAMIIALAGCQSKRAVALSSDVKMSDSASAKQLIDGFHPLEEHKWRWTARRFAVVLQPPAGSERTGATLRLQLFIPDLEIATLGPITLTADVNDVSLASETFTKAGTFSYSRAVPPALLHNELLPVVFSFDKALSTPDDRRELAAVVTEVSLERNN